MKKGNLFNSMKTVKKSIKDDLLQVGAALVGGVLGDVAYTKGKEQMPDNYKKYTGAVVGLAGGALSVFAKHPILKAGAFGMVGSAGTNILNDLAPDVSVKLGLSGMTETQPENNDLSDLEREMLKAYAEQSEKAGVSNGEMPGVQE